MKDKKHIDELFKERFKNFEATPSPQVWTNIQAKLNKEKDRKVVPLWLRWSGVAAILILLLLAGNAIFDPFGTSNDNSITTETTDEVDPSDNVDVITNDSEDSNSEIASEDDIDTMEEASDENSEGEKNYKPEDPVVKQSGTSRDAVANENIPKQKTEIDNRDPKIKRDAVETIRDTQDATAKTTENKTEAEKNTGNEKNIIPEKEVIVKENTGIANTEKNTEDKNTNIDKEDDIIKRDIDIIDTETPVVTATENENTEKTEEKTDEKTTENENEKRSLIDVINEKNEKEAVAKNNTPDRRWEVTPNVGPVYYDSFGSGSSIDPSFSDNPQSSDINFSYGVAVSYNITERFSVRSGVNSVRLSYSTGGIELADGPVSVGLKSVNYGDQQTVTTAFDAGTLATTPMGGPFEDVRPKSGGGNPQIIQRINYYEVPVEMRYSLLNKRFGVSMIGGFSTLFLGNNEISVADGTLRTTLGEANNLNSLSFATNIGLGFDYKISRSLRFNLEPILKYQLNPYSDSSVNFRPYYFGIYTGLSFKF